MALVRCAECGKTISQYASQCPNCGVGLEPMSDELYARIYQRNQEIRRQDGQFTKKVLCTIGILVVLATIFGPSSDDRQNERERDFRHHVNTLEEQQRQKESDGFWRGVGMEKNGGGQ